MTNQRHSTVSGLLEAKREGLAQLCRQYHVRRLELFGSATTGQASSRTPVISTS